MKIGNRFLSLIIALVLIFMPVSRPLADSMGTIEVNGEASLSVRPDRADLNISLVEIGRDPKEISGKNNLKMKGLKLALKDFGIKEEDIKTSNIGLEPNYRQNKGEDEFLGYKSIYGISIQVRDLKALGPIIDLTIKKGADEIRNINYYNSKSEAYYRDSLKLAFKDAEKKARTLEEVSGLKIKGVRAIKENSRNYNRPISQVVEKEAIESLRSGDTEILIRDILISSELVVEFIH